MNDERTPLPPRHRAPEPAPGPPGPEQFPPPTAPPRPRQPMPERDPRVGRFEAERRGRGGGEPDLLTHDDGLGSGGFVGGAPAPRPGGPGPGAGYGSGTGAGTQAPRRVGSTRWADSSGGTPGRTRVGPPPGRTGGGPGGPGGPPPPGYGGDGGGSGDGSGPTGRGRRVRKILGWTAAVLLIGPLVAFAIGWAAFAVPEPDTVYDMQVATINYADGNQLATIRPEGGQNRQKVTLNQVPKSVQYAVMAAEDRSFLRNPGFDIIGILRAIKNQLTGGVGGGSTITQQYIKVTTNQDQISLFRKYKEIVLAVKMSNKYNKDEILERYLNAIYFGRGSYGIQAATQAYFGKDAQNLTPSEGALLAGMIQSPSRWDPAKNPQKATERWNFVLDGMVLQGWLNKADRNAQRFPQTIAPKPAGGGIPADDKGHIYTQVKAELEAKGISEQQLNQEGLKITTTIDPALQKLAGDTAAKVLKGQPKNLRSALVSVDPRTGAVWAYYGGQNGVGLDYAQVLKQPGSSFKPFVMAAALQQSPPIGLGERFDGSSPQTILGLTVNNSEGVSCDNCSLQTAMTQSINTVFYNLAVKVGASKVADAAHEAGIPKDLLPTPTAGIALGDKEVHPFDMAAAFGTFAADGIWHKPHFVTKVETADGRVLLDETPGPGEQRIDAQVARNVTESMIDVASSSSIGLSDGRAVAAKTGTVQSRIQGQNNDAWTVGYTPSYSTAVWVGTDDNSAIKTSGGRPVYGRMLPGSMWQQFMSGATRGKPREPFSKLEPLGTPASSDEDFDSSESGSEDSGDGDSGDSEKKRKKRAEKNKCDEDGVVCDEDGNRVRGERNGEDTNNDFDFGDPFGN